MYLVHVSLHAPAGPAELPDDTRELLLAAAVTEEGIEHVSVHAGAVPHPVLGVFVLADGLEDAEERAQAFCRRVVALAPGLTGWRVRGAQAPLVAAFYERLLAGPGPAGRNGPGTIPST
ncbi:hypothetical protein [Kitasatospora sp. NPDC008115]|uniref:hypothetical protein n=1 Tax=Kitasatospora sp. NPDC008115 TaxID=3364022 RepID=UPI0036E10D66